MTIDKYKDLITSQHKTRPKFMGWLSDALTLVDNNIAAANSLPGSFDVDAASGVQLDVIGQIVGQSRALDFQPAGGEPPVLDDDNYRTVLKAKIAQNQWDGTIPKIYDLWNAVFPNIQLNIVDNQNMTMSAVINGPFDDVITELVTGGYIIPKPAGVSLTIIEVTPISGDFYAGAVVSGQEQITISTIIPT